MNKFKDEKGRFIVQGLFLEDRYNTDLAVFTYADDDKEYKGKTYPSLKKLYINHADPVEYDFATTHLDGWKHWQRLCNNAIVGRAIEEWREELSLKLMSEGVQQLVQIATEKDSYQAAKWLADRGWDVAKRGRPSKDEVDGAIKKAAEEQAEWGEGVELLETHRKK